MDFRVDLLRRGFGDVLGARHAVAQEDFFLVLGIGDRAQLVRHAEARDHGARHAGGLLDVALRAGRDLVMAEDQFLGQAAAEGDGQVGQHLLAGQRQLHRVPAGASPCPARGRAG